MSKPLKIMNKKEDGTFVHEENEKGYVYKNKRGLRKGDYFQDYDENGAGMILEVAEMIIDEFGGIVFSMKLA